MTTHITDKEAALTTALRRMTEALTQVTAERDALTVRLQGVVNTFANEIDELRAEVEQWKIKEADWMAAYQSAYQDATKATVRKFQLGTKVAAQRKVLEQALEAIRLRDEPQGVGRGLCKLAITAIQEQLK